MSQENMQPDTPQDNAEQQYESLEEAVFGEGFEGSENIESAFTDGNEGEAAPDKGQPAQETTTEASNDEKRYQYWQSQADKLKNENEALKSQYNQQAVQQNQMQMQNAQVESPVDEFPAPPEKPGRPRNFNREEAYNDPSSDSARYLDAVEDWRDDIAEYNTIKTQYDNAVVQEKIEAMEHQKVQEAQRFQARQVQMQQVENVKSHVMGHHGMSENEAQDFMQRMSDPKSLNVDNLVQLYRMQQGGAPVQNNVPAQPSAEFRQVQNAQQVPSPMGVMPSGQNNTDSRSMEDKMMDTMIGNFNSKNPWK